MEGIEGKYSVGGIYEATVSNLTDYGCFAELEQGVEGPNPFIRVRLDE